MEDSTRRIRQARRQGLQPPSQETRIMSNKRAAEAEAIPQDEIAERARALWVARGSPGGRDLEHWLDAERQLREEYAARNRPGNQPRDLVEDQKRLDGLIEEEPSPARRTPAGESL